MSSEFGRKLTVTVFGESHGPAVGVTVCGLPAGEAVDADELAAFLARRAPGRSRLSTARREPDLPRFLSGLKDGATTGFPLTAVIENTDVRPADYAALADTPRPGHADYPAFVKYGGRADLRGGGAFSGRLTAPVCTAGGIALQLLRRRGVSVGAHVLAMGGVRDEPFPDEPSPALLELLAARELPVLSEAAAGAMRAAVEAAAAEGDSVGGVVECAALGVPAGLGGPLFEGVEGRLAAGLFGIPAVKGVEFGAGFAAAELRGSENNDAFRIRNGRVVTETNRCGGILGGVTDGMPLVFRAAFKPTPSIARPQRTVSLSRMEDAELAVRGRHDPCVVPRAVPVVEAVAALCILDLMIGG